MTATPSPGSAADAPLEGVRVVEAADLLPGPYTGFLLASFGARVTKIERPGGEPARGQIPALFAALNRGKESVVLDLMSDPGRQALRRLIARADVVLCSYRPMAARKLGLDGAAVLAANPRAIYAALTGYGLTGPRAATPGHDLNFQAAAGVLPLDGHPVLPWADLVGGLAAALGVLAALQGRQRTRAGAILDASLTDALAALATVRRVRSPPPERPAYALFDARDGRRLALGCVEDPFFLRAMEAMGLVIADPSWRTREGRAPHAATINAAIAGVVATRDRDAWLDRFAAADVPASPVNTPANLGDDPGLAARGFARPGVLPLTPGQLPDRDAPALGADTGRVLAELESG